MRDLFVWIVFHLAFLGLMLLAALGLGQVFLRRIQFDSTIERLVFTTAVGLGIAACLIFVLGLLGLIYGKLFLLLTVLAAAAGAAHLAGLCRTELMILQRRKFYPSIHGAFHLFLIAVLIAFWFLLLRTTQYPPVHWDAISHHLVLSQAYLTNHRLVPVPGNTHPALAALNHMLFVWAMALKDDILAQMIEHTFMMLVAIGLYAWGKRTQKPLLGLALAGFWLGQPLVLWLGESAYVDVCLVCFVFLGVYALRIFRDSQNLGWWYLAIALLGFAAGVKMGGVFFLLVGVAFGTWTIGRGLIWNRAASGPGWMAIPGGAVLGLALALPWYIFVAYHTGSPVYPITKPAVANSLAGLAASQTDPRTLSNFLRLPFDWIRYPARFYAANNLTLSPLIVLWPLAWIVAVRNASVRWWTAWAFSFTVYWFFFPHELRYWLPALPLAGLALYESIDWCLQKFSKPTLLRAGVWTMLTLGSLYWSGRGVVEELRIKDRPPTNSSERSAFLEIMAGNRAVTFINDRAGVNETVAVFRASWLNYYLKPQVLDLSSGKDANLRPKFRWPDDQSTIGFLQSRNVNWILFARDYAGGFLHVPESEVNLNAWPAYELVYADATMWVFRRRLTSITMKSVRTESD